MHLAHLALIGLTSSTLAFPATKRLVLSTPDTTIVDDDLTEALGVVMNQPVIQTRKDDHQTILRQQQGGIKGTTLSNEANSIIDTAAIFSLQKRSDTPPANPGAGQPANEGHPSRPEGSFRSSLPLDQFIETFDEAEREYLYICVTSKRASYRFRGNKSDPPADVVERWYHDCVEHIRERVRIQERFWGNNESDEADPGFPWFSFSRLTTTNNPPRHDDEASVVNSRGPGEAHPVKDTSDRDRQGVKIFLPPGLLEFSGRLGRALEDKKEKSRGITPSTFQGGAGGVGPRPIFAVP